MAKILAGFLTVSILALVFASCGRGQESVSTTSSTAIYAGETAGGSVYDYSQSTRTIAPTTSIATPATVAPPAATPPSPNSQWLFSNGPINIGSGDLGQLSVVSVAPIDTNEFYSLVAFTFRNNTAKTAASISASLRVFDSSGGLFLTENTLSGDVQPLAVQPGEWGFGYFHIDPIPQGSRLQVQLSSGSTSSRSNLKVTNATTRSDRSTVQSSAIISNTSANTVIATANFLCLDQNGNPVGFGNQRFLLPEAQRRIGSEFTISTNGVGLHTKSCPVLAVFSYS